MSTQPWESEVNLAEAVTKGFIQSGGWSSSRLSELRK